MNAKSSIYKMLRIWNDRSAIKRGKIGKRLGRRVVGKVAGKGLANVSSGWIKYYVIYC